MNRIRKILIIDDEIEICKAVELFLKETEAYEPLFATTGNEGVQLAKQFKPDLILLDMLLPDISGTDVAMELKENPETLSIPVVFMTGLATEEDLLITDHPYNHILPKPFSAEDVIIKIEEVLNAGE